MPLLQKIDYITNSWPSSGVVDSANSGFDIILAGASYVPATISEPNFDGKAEGSFIEFPVGVGSGNGNRPFVTSTFFQSGETDAWMHQYIRAILVDKDALPASGTKQRGVIIISGGTKFFLDVKLVGTTSDNPGFAMQGFTFFGPADVNAFNSLSSKPIIRFNQIFQFSLHYQNDAAAGKGAIEVFVNGTKVYEALDGGLTGAITISAMQSNMAFALQALTGVKWQILGAEAWSGLDQPANMKDEFRPINDEVSQAFLPNTVFDTTRTGLNGLTMENPEGVLAWTASIYSTGGINISTSRYVITGSTGGIGSIKTRAKLGNLKFNEFGWATILQRAIRLNSTSVKPFYELAIRDDADINNVIEISVDSVNGRLQQGGVDLLDAKGNVIPINADSYYGIMIHLHSSGTATITIENKSKSHGASEQTFWSAQLSNWIPQLLGVAKMSLTKGDQNCEIEPPIIYKTVTLNMGDSTSSTNYNGVTPNYAVGQRIMNTLNRVEIWDYLPGFGHDNYLLSDASSQPLMSYPICAARTGSSMGKFVTHNINNDAFKFTNGVRFVVLDGGTVNDILSTESTISGANTRITNMKNNFESFVDGILVGQNRLLICPIVPRENAGYTELANEVMKRHNENLILIAHEKQTVDQRIDYSSIITATEDIFGVYFDGVDNVHFTNGEPTYAQHVIDRVITTPPPKSSPVVNPESSTQFVNIRGVLDTAGINNNAISQTLNIIKNSTGKDLRVLIFDNPSEIRVTDDQGMDTFTLNVYAKSDLITIVKTITLGRNGTGIYIKENGLDDLSSLAVGEYWLVWSGIGTRTQSSWFADPFVMKVIVTGSG